MTLNHRGFTLGEVLASLIALGIIALTVQSLMLVANNFLSQQSSAMSSMQEQTFFSKLICHKFQRPVFVNQNPKRSFKYDPDDSAGPLYLKRADARPNPEQKPATLSVPLLGHSNSISSLSASGHSAVQTFLTTELTTPADEDDHSQALRAHINDKAASFSDIVGGGSRNHNYHSQFYDIYADDHTLPTFMVKQGEESGIRLGKVSEGFIYASRCIQNGKGNLGNGGSFIEIGGASPKYSIIDRTDNSAITDDDVLATALYVLEQKWRPFYFPKQDKAKNEVICCDISAFDSTTSITLGTSTSSPSIPGNCANLENYTPIIYVIKISSDGSAFENLISGNDSLAGYVQNSLSEFISHDDCESSGQVDLNSSNCKDIAENSYFRELGKRLVHPVKFENVEELPLVKKDRVNTWAYGFIAPSFKNQIAHKEFKILSIENKCHTSLPVGLCGKAVPGLILDITTNPENAVNNKSVADYFISRVSHCPFSYISMDSSGGTLPLGLDRVE
ncbi:MAG: hypothetical protein OXK80_03930 [Bdellovibrionales bacterium]|nr:hypothetical protein [Bdellovibrionales bacterium]